MDYAYSIFLTLDDPGTFDFNTMIRAHVKDNDPEAALLLYKEMQERSVRPDNFTFPFALKACAQLSATGEGIVFEQMGSDRTVASWSAILAAHTRMGLWNECLKLFAMMTAEGLRADESSMVSALSSCAHIWGRLAMHGDGEKALQVFSNMLKEGIEPDEAIYVGVLSACSHAGLLEDGFRCFDQMRLEHRIMPNVQHYGCMVDLMSHAGKLNEAYEVIRSMPTGPTDVAWRCLLNACKVRGNLELAECASKNLMQLDAHNAGDHIILSNMEWQLRFEGYTPDTSQVHSQKLAIAFAFVNTSYQTPIRIVTNLRMSEECHTYTALISKIFEREIIVGDHNRFHCFRQGACSCGGYW
ncbi:pentatricopeptide repeat-containing protein [Cocos nucifera]|uniref:Pentatricopeptide repeat-containing protein n=1 Tax=Cocos nucifera TaxID=13894 RepID=A0A8K0IE54_COCNU|nr:pentatricopeptide repeat-containing protein [Cocos nucifera]